MPRGRTLPSPRLSSFLLDAHPADDLVAYVLTRPQLASGQCDVEDDHRLNVQTGEALPRLSGQIEVLALLIPFPVAVGCVQDLGDGSLDV